MAHRAVFKPCSRQGPYNALRIIIGMAVLMTFYSRSLEKKGLQAGL